MPGDSTVFTYAKKHTTVTSMVDLPLETELEVFKLGGCNDVTCVLDSGQISIDHLPAIRHRFALVTAPGILDLFAQE